ncbi:MAG: protein kinase [Lachnospiraceae bacterium]|nr:protein kinase [Lachnospiraceae bacterium]
MKQNGDMVTFLRNKDYIMQDNNLGGGAFGKAVLLNAPYIDELFVAKMYKPLYEWTKEKFYANFLDEIKILYKLNHPNIVRIYNYYAYEKQCTGYIIMEYIDGKDIGDFFEEYNKECEEVVTVDEIFVQLINAFTYIEEKGVVHRDIREGNIRVDINGTVKVIDFGIGKILMSSKDICDSLVRYIDREGSDTLPKEYHDGIYTSHTDMFYLAELFNRLLKKITDKEIKPFSYYNILNKMMEKNPKDRYGNFREIKELIEQQNFVEMPISNEDKRIYQEFTNYICESLISYKMEQKFNYNTQNFIYKLESALEENVFEDYIQNNAQIIGGIVTSGYRYRTDIQIPCCVVKDFLVWFKKSTKDYRKLILRNIIVKLSTIKVVFEFDEELPFN